MQVKFFTKDSLKKANDEAIRSKRNQSLRTSVVEKLSDTLRFPIAWSMPHNDQEMRCQLLLDADNFALLDVKFKTYDSLPSVDMPRSS